MIDGKRTELRIILKSGQILVVKDPSPDSYSDILYLIQREAEGTTLGFFYNLTGLTTQTFIRVSEIASVIQEKFND